ncbi:hypothetical protein ACFSCX_23730 [Bacillus salitolerans]|uniref:Uncharacterized protein n=1 Tax=Bacillus salitolerans TaxID=1437434 RepID=A0ABW4LY46_9BACI
MANLRSNAKAFIHERVIYEYMMNRFDESNLKMKHIVKDGRLLHKEKTIRVSALAPIDTLFPDVKYMKIEGDGGKHGRPGEIKFITSDFNYHKDEIEKFNEFKKQRGCIIVLRHDELPKGLLDVYNEIDVFELDRNDFERYVKANFDWYFHKQLQSRDPQHYKIWIMSQSRNFYKWNKKSNVEPAFLSGRWCPKEKGLTGYDISKNDKVIFVKFGREFQISNKVQKCWNEREEIYHNWYIDNIYIADVTLPLTDRKDYCEFYGKDINSPLWMSEVTSKKLWPRVFEFKNKYTIDCDINLKEMYNDLPNIVHPKMYYALTQQMTMEINESQYSQLLEYVLYKQSYIELENRIINTMVTKENNQVGLYEH